MKIITSLGIKILLLFFLLLPLLNKAQIASRFGTWEDVEAFDINKAEDHIIIAKNIEGKTKLFETKKVVFGWTEATPIDIINNYGGGTADIGGPFLSIDSKRLYFHANFPDSKGGFDIYYTNLSPNGWSEPINLGSPINTITDQLYPSITPGQERIYFSESYPTEYEYKKPKTSPACQQIHTAIKKPDQKWGNPYKIHQVVNTGCVFSPVIANDGSTLFFSSIDTENQKEGFKLTYAKESGKEIWEFPNYIEINEDLEGDKLNPRIVNNTLYFLRCYKEKKLLIKHLYSKPISSKIQPKTTIYSKGKILTKVGDRPIEAELTIFNPTTLNVLAKYQSDKHSGEFELCLLDKKKYLVEVRKHGYSFANYMLDYTKEEKVNIPELIQLFDTIELALSVFDSEIFSPLTVEAKAENNNENLAIEGTLTEEGVYSFKLPLGCNYNVSAYADWYDQKEFLFKLEGDIVFSKFNRNLPLKPQKNIFSILSADSETGAVFIAEGFLVNLTSDEPPIFFSADNIDEDGNLKISLRKGDQYELTMNKEGYFFHSQVIDLQGEAKDSTPIVQNNENEFALKVVMDSLREDKAITLENIVFQNNSASLSTSTFSELDKVIQVMRDNPNIFIEISAHTDDIGSAHYNNVLSDKRAQSVVNYMLENEIPMEQLIPKGYGFTQPKVPNDSDENRALNRRVEFKVIKKEEMQSADANQ